MRESRERLNRALTAKRAARGDTVSLKRTPAALLADAGRVAASATAAQGNRLSPRQAGIITKTSGLLGTLEGKDGTHLLGGVEIWQASALFVLGFAPTVTGTSLVARKYDRPFSDPP